MACAAQGHVVTNYHVLGSILKRLPQQRQQRSPSNGSGPPGPKVARIALLSTPSRLPVIRCCHAALI